MRRDRYVTIGCGIAVMAMIVVSGCATVPGAKTVDAKQQATPAAGCGITGCLPPQFPVGAGEVDLYTCPVPAGRTPAPGSMKKLEKEETPAQLRGMVSMVNEKVSVGIPAGSRAILFQDRAGVLADPVQLIPAGDGLQDAVIEGVNVVQNDFTDVAVEVMFAGKSAKATIRLELGVGKPILRTKAVGAKALRVLAPARYGIQPDFIGDDTLVDATVIAAEKHKPPKGHFFMLMLAKGDAMLLGVWDKEPDGAQMTLAGTGADRKISEMELPYGDKGQVCLTLLAEKGIWNSFDISRDMIGKVVDAAWKPPYIAEWRCNFVRKDHTLDSWIFKYNLADRTQTGSTVGKYLYPCWFDGTGSAQKACVQTLSYEAKEYTPEYIGTVLVYPLNRMKKTERVGETPLTTFTVMDIVRESLGIGPCPGATMQMFRALKESK